MYDRRMQHDDIAARIEAFDDTSGGGVGYYKDKGAYHLYLLETEAPVARLKPTGNRDEVRLGYWSHRALLQNARCEGFTSRIHAVRRVA